MSLFSTAFDFLTDTIKSVVDIFDGDSIFKNIGKAGIATLDKRLQSPSIMNRMNPNLRAKLHTSQYHLPVYTEFTPGAITGGMEKGIAKSVDIESIYAEWKTRLAILSGEYEYKHRTQQLY